MTPYTLRGLNQAELQGNSTGAASCDVYRGGTSLTTTSATAYADNTGRRGAFTATYRVCEAATEICSDDVAASW